jgi:hypothetical protein
MTCVDYRETLLDTGHPGDCEACARWSQNQARIAEGLAALAKSETRGPSATIEAALLRDLLRAPTAAPRPIRWKAVAAFAGAVAAGLALMFVLRQHPEPPSVVANKPPAPSAAPQAKPEPVVVARHQRKRKLARRPAAAPPRAVPQQVETAEFIEVPFSVPLGRDERARLVQVAMPAATLAAWGISPVPGDPDRVINADVVVGENGLARAFRLVR